MPQVEDFRQRYILDASQFEGELRSVGQQGRRFRRQMRRGLNQTEEGFDRAERSASSFRSTMSRLATAVAGFFASFSAGMLVRKMMRISGSVEQTEVAFETFLGSAERADQLMSEIFDFTGQTPFQFEEVNRASKILLAFGSDVENIQKELRMLGNLASGTGQPLNELALIFGKARTQGRLFAEDMNQLHERGIPLAQALADEYGRSTEAIKEMVSAGEVGFDELMVVLENMTTEGGQFAGLIEQMSQTWVGLQTTLRDEIKRFMLAANEQLFQALKDDLDEVVDTMRRMREDGSMREWAEGVGDALIGMYESIRTTLRFLREWGPTIMRVVTVLATLKAGIIAVRTAQMTWMVATRTMKTVMLAWEAAVLAGNAAINLLAGNIAAARNAMIAFGVAWRTNPIGIISTVVSAAAGAWLLFRDNTEEATEALKDQREAVRNLTRDIEQLEGAMADQRTAMLEQEMREVDEQIEALRSADPATAGGQQLRAFRGGYLFDVNGELLTQEQIQERINTLMEERQNIGQGLAQLDAQRQGDLEAQLAMVRRLRDELAARTDLTDAQEERLAMLNRQYERIQAKIRARKETGGEEGGDPGQDGSEDGERYKQAFEDKLEEVGEEVDIGVFGLESNEAPGLQIESRIEDFQQRMTELQNMRSAGEISDQEYFSRVRSEAEEFRTVLVAIWGQLQAIGDIPPELQKIFEEAFGLAEGALDDTGEEGEETEKQLSAVGNRLQDLARAGRAIQQMFGDMSEGARMFADGLLSAIDNLGRLLEIYQTLKDQEALGSASGMLQMAIPAAGILGGVVSIFRGLTRSTDRNSEEMARLSEKMTDLADSFRDSVRELIRRQTVGGSVAPGDVREAQNVFERLTGSIETSYGPRGRRRISTQLTESQIEIDLRRLEDLTGLEDLDEMFSNMVERGFSLAEALQALTSSGGELQEALQQLTERYGQAGQSIDGMIRQAQLMADLGFGRDEIFEAVSESFEEVGLSEALIEAIGQARSSGESVPDMLRRILIGEGPVSLMETGLAPDDIERLIEVFESMPSAGESQEQEFERSRQITGTITEIQTNELLAYQQAQVRELERISGLLAGMGSAGKVPRLQTSQNGDINLTVQAGRSIDEVMAEIERELSETSLFR